MAGIAFFDLDKTITREGTWSRFVRLATPDIRFFAGLPALAAQAAAYKAGMASRGSVKERAVALFLRDRKKTELQAVAKDFAEAELQTGVRPGALAAIQGHRDAGDRLVIASAAADLIVEAMAEQLGFDDIICTRLSWSADHRLLTALNGENCYGLEKLRRVDEYLDAQASIGQTSFYSDHITDLPCLDRVDYGAAVHPEPGLRRVARQKNMPILDWE